MEEKKKHPLTVLAFLEIGLFEIVFVITGVLLLLGTINYFNLLPVSDTFPKYLSWLPKQKVKINNNQIYNDFLKQYYGSKGTPTPTPILPSKQTAENLLSSFVSENLSLSLASSLTNMRFREDQIANSDKDIFYATWDSEIGTLSATLHLEPSSKTLSSLYFSSILKNNSPISLFLETVKDFSSKVFKTKLYGDWGCREEVSSVYCENFGENPNGVKIGVSVQQLKPNPQKLYLTYCEFHENSQPMYGFKSCSLKFSKTGISP